MERFTDLLGFEARFVVYPVLALAIAGIIRLVIHRFLGRWVSRTKSKVDDQIVSYIKNLTTPLLLIIILYYLCPMLPLAEKSIRYLREAVFIAGILLVAYFSAKLISVILRVLAEEREGLRKFSQPLRILSNVFFLLLGIALVLRRLNVNLGTEGARFIRVIGIAAGAFVVMKIIRLAVEQMERMVEDEDVGSLSEAEKRAKTLGKIINNASMVLVIGVAAMMVLSEFGMDITPIITGAGIAGLAVGFGAQNLVRDIISGFFLIMEDQIRVGDVARINGIGGVVEAIRLRTTVLRDLEGVVHIFPNGEIHQVANLTKEFSCYVINVGVAYKENVDDVMELLKQIGAELQQDAELSPLILAPLEVLGVDDFGDSQVTIKIRIKTVPLKQWQVGRELRRRIKNTFDKKGIEIPFPHLSVYFGEASKPFDLMLNSARPEGGPGKSVADLP